MNITYAGHGRATTHSLAPSTYLKQGWLLEPIRSRNGELCHAQQSVPNRDGVPGTPERRQRPPHGPPRHQRLDLEQLQLQKALPGLLVLLLDPSDLAVHRQHLLLVSSGALLRRRHRHPLLYRNKRRSRHAGNTHTQTLVERILLNWSSGYRCSAQTVGDPVYIVEKN
jgi:hypothetical protein